ncbi:GM19487 [Drosophila sechellia]|uniref:GD17979 n=2 Tax=melanogaster subgroup TaxID=32351 RepID=B4R306_DROSI|nr:GM19487 [Drosophila sechellia]EDX16860.1 GD17979 [Drosophila simulans]
MLYFYFGLPPPIVSCLIFVPHGKWQVPCGMWQAGCAAVRQEEQQEAEGGTNAPRDDGIIQHRVQHPLSERQQ